MQDGSDRRFASQLRHACLLVCKPAPTSLFAVRHALCWYASRLRQAFLLVCKPAPTGALLVCKAAPTSVFTGMQACSDKPFCWYASRLRRALCWYASQLRQALCWYASQLRQVCLLVCKPAPTSVCLLESGPSWGVGLFFLEKAVVFAFAYFHFFEPSTRRSLLF